MKCRASLLTSLALVSATSFVSPESDACGGLFCSASQPVNQAAERILFAKNDDGTVTAVIQILYEGPASGFSWLLPISTVPDPETGIGVASDVAFTRLQRATNPRYTLTTRVEGDCRAEPPVLGSAGAGGSSAQDPSGEGGAPDSGGVTVEASGQVGPFDWTVISLDSSLDDPADAAVQWLEANDYAVLPGSPEKLGPYLADGMYLLALRLTKDSDVGSIRPIVLTYEADKPIIPIKLTAVAANDDMGVMTWVLGESRAVPFNYYSLELNEAYIDWMTGGTNYESVVTRAADEAGGQGFVTEYADSTANLATAVWPTTEEERWGRLRDDAEGLGAVYFYNQTATRYGLFSGFREVALRHLTLPDGVGFDEFNDCPFCYDGEVELDLTGFVEDLEEEVIAPVRRVQELIDDHRYVTRLYSTLSAAEMTEDPLFAFNSELDDVSNVHTAQRVVECDPSLYFSQAPWRIELPQGGTLRGSPDDPTPELPDQPANRRILQLGEKGPGVVAEDNSELLVELNDPPRPVPPSSDDGGEAGLGGAPARGGGDSNGGARASGGARPTGGARPGGGTGPAAGAKNEASSGDDSGCSIGAPLSSDGALTLLGFSALAFVLRRRR